MTNRFTLKLGRFYSNNNILQMDDVCDLLNEMDNRIMRLEDDYEKYSLGNDEPKLENPRFKITGCPTEIQDTCNNHFYWLEHEGNVKGICDVLNDLDCQNQLLCKERDDLINGLKAAISHERTALGLSVLIALAERWGVEL